MILSFEFIIFVYVFLSALFWVIKSFVSHKWALRVLILANIILLSAINTTLFLILLFQIGLLTLIFFLLKSKEFPTSSRLPWLLFLTLIPIHTAPWFDTGELLTDFVTSFAGKDIPDIVWNIGSIFFVMKSYVILKESIREKRLIFTEALANLTFIPSFPAGPVHGVQPWKKEVAHKSISVETIWQAFLRLGYGLAALYIFAPFITGVVNEIPEGVIYFVPVIMLQFAAIFFDFAGYTQIAISLALLFGIVLPENFNRPYLATSVQQFWQRWHMSLSRFISTYLFKPFVRKTGSPPKGIFLAFFAAGFWHEFSLGYIIWGFGHGSALSLCMKPPKFWLKFKSWLHPKIYFAFCWFFTMFWVSLLSHIANRFGHGFAR